jgi:hypothetical protein
MSLGFTRGEKGELKKLGLKGFFHRERLLEIPGWTVGRFFKNHFSQQPMLMTEI